jgi:hypothetical protein
MLLSRAVAGSYMLGRSSGVRMPKKWTHTAAFEHFGAKPRNVQWSWSARSEDEKTVVVTLWQDEFVRRDGRLVYERGGDPDNPDTRPGLRELMDNLAWARDHCDGRFRVISAVAKDRNARPRAIKECAPTKMIMRLTHLDVQLGAFTAEAEGL